MSANIAHDLLRENASLRLSLAAAHRQMRHMLYAQIITTITFVILLVTQ